VRFKVAIEALKERQTISELTAKFGVHATQITLWKKQLLEEGLEVFKEATKGKKDSWSVGSISRLANYRWNWTAAADRWLKKIWPMIPIRSGVLSKQPILQLVLKGNVS